MKYIFPLAVLWLNTVFCHTPYLQDNIYNQSRIDKIPKTIHQIWVGPKRIPKSYRVFADTIKKMHPEWEYKLWTNADVESFPWINKELFDKTTNPGMKSDIWRYEILHRYGGLYLDMDIESLRAFDPLHERLEFYAGFCGQSLVNISVIGSVPGSPILARAIYELSNKVSRLNFKNIVVSTVMNETGPFFFTDLVNKNPVFFQNPRHVILPEKYFQPIFHGNCGTAKTAEEKFHLKNTCFVNHRNGCSWM